MSLGTDGQMDVVPDHLVLSPQSGVSWQLCPSVAGDLGEIASYKLHVSDMNNPDSSLRY